MYINSQNKQLKLQPLQGIITQGEKMADSVTFALPAVYGSLSLSDLSWNIRAASEKDTLATAALSVSTANDKCLLTWEVSSDFTAVSGALSLMLVGTDAAGNTVIKFPGDSPIWVRDSETGAYSPPEDAIENALNGLQQAEQALQDAITTLKEIGISLDVRGWYDTLEALQSAVPTPEIGWVYGVGDPTVLYVYNGVEWVSLPGVSSTPPLPLSIANGGTGGTSVAAALANLGAQPGFNLLVNSRFKYNGRNQTTYTGAVWTVDGWKCGASNTITVTDEGVLVSSSGSSGISFNQPIQRNLLGKNVTLSFYANGEIAFVSGTIPNQTPTASSTLFSQNTSWGAVAIAWYASDNAIVAVASVSNGQTVTLTAAKLELGSVSTLAADLATAQDETIEQLRLDMYDLDPGRPAWVLTQNENLLDNWYFVGGGSQQNGGQFPINQRGQTSYNLSNNSGYGIDRWWLVFESFNVNTGTISSSTTTGYTGAMRQAVANAQYLAGRQVTLSLLASSLNGNATIGLAKGTGLNSGVSSIASAPLKNGLNALSINLPSDLGSENYPYFLVSVSVPFGSSVTLIAAKLELGLRSTLARLVDGEWVLNDPPPNFQQELAKCQRMYQIYSSATERPSNGYDCRPVMRLAAPSQGTILINDQTWYYNDANL